MQNNPNNNIPDEDKIEQLLSGFKPQPTPRLNTRMSSAPWQIRDTSQPSTITKKWSLRWKPAWVLVTLIIALAFLILSFIPSVRATADQIIHFFLPSSSDRLEVQVTPVNSLDSMDFSNPSNFPLNVITAQQQAGFVVKEIPSSPTAPTFIGARFDPSYNAIILLYKGEGYDLLFTQRPLRNSQDVFSIGSDAHVEFVNIGDVQAEYVVGGWNAVSTQVPAGNPSPSGAVHIIAVWDNSLPQSTLRWQKSGFAYELRCNGENSLSQQQLISLANGLK
jgi:hypothetical protein